MSLPDKFDFQYFDGYTLRNVVYTAIKEIAQYVVYEGGRRLTSYAAGMVQECVDEGTWKICKGEEMNKKLPKKFVMALENGSAFSKYTVEQIGDDAYRWTRESTGYNSVASREEVEAWLNVHGYKIVEVFEEETVYPELKPFMRVETRNGNVYMVVPHTNESGVALCREEGWMTAHFTNDKGECDDGYLIDKVQDAPKFAYQMLDLTYSGDIIWKREEEKEEPAVDEAIKQRLEYFQTHIDAVKENLESLQREYDELKEAV